MLYLAAIVAAACAAGCGGPPPDVWVVNDMVNLTDQTPRRDDPLIFNAKDNSVNLFAAANETISFQLVIQAGEQGARDLSVRFSDLAGPADAKINKARIQTFGMWPVRIDHYPPWYLRLVKTVPEPANFYDALVPLVADASAQPLNLSANERLAVWVDLSVPRDALPGDYTGLLSVCTGAIEAWTINVKLKVYDFVLPDARPVAAVGGFDYRTLFRRFLKRQGKPFVPARMDRKHPLVRRGLVLMRQCMQLAHAHRLDLFDKHIHPVIKRDMFGKMHLDWEDYDAIVMPYLTGTAFEDRIGCAAWCVPFSDTWPNPNNYGGAHTDTYASTVGTLVAACRDHFAKATEMQEQTFLWPYRGEVSRSAYDRHVALGRIARAADSETPILCQLPTKPPAETDWQAPKGLSELVDIHAPPAQWLDPARAEKLARPEHPLVGMWLSPAMPPYSPSLGIIATPADVRAIAWFTMKYKCTGLFLPEVMHWDGDLFSTGAGAETRLFYPGDFAGREAVLPSVRLKRLRRGLQDIAYLWLLQQRQRRAVARGIIDAMTRYAGLASVGDNYLDPRLDGWVQDPAAWEMARRLLAEEVQVAVHPAELSNQELVAQRLAWKRFDETTRTVRVEQIRARVTAADKANRLRATVLLDLYNEHSRNVDVLVKIDNLPKGWRATTDEVAVSPLPAARRKVVRLEAEGLHVPIMRNAKSRMPISITVDAQRTRQMTANIPLLRAGWVDTAPRIDGVLDDWPMRAGNTAGDFRLVGKRGRGPRGLAERSTLVFILHDAKNLYFAFRCEEPNMDAIVAKPNNVIHYEQLMACGEDLVEIILDPGAEALRPEQLYHITVKSNGVLLTERGVYTDPPLGKARPWPVAASVAVKRYQKLWTVELALPLESFSQAGRAKFWGVNFTRFATQGAEASSWSEAPRIFYDPKNLGTMFVMPAAKITNEDSSP
ncbi:MAG: DUF4091 domain-containing protein [Planctomycetota bacterium]|nr:DUF4091 domain-containing protein [Planctomycetota bacterium]